MGPKVTDQVVVFRKRANAQPKVPLDKSQNPYHSDFVTIETLQVIFKVSERCNLACPYCYYFYAGDNSAEARPPLFKISQLEPIVLFLEQGIKDFSIKVLNIVFHGGEPMLMKPQNFLAMCRELRGRLGGITSLQLGMQTNGTLISDEWLEVLHSQDVFFGISIDGPAKYHDLYRFDHSGRGSHGAIVSNLERAKRFYKSRNAEFRIGTVSVMNHLVPVEEVYSHLVEDLGIRSVGFLLPDRSHDQPFKGDGESAQAYGMQLANLFDCWLNDDSDTAVREIREVLRFFQVVDESKSDSNYGGLTAQVDVQREFVSNQIIVIQSDGTLSVDDSLIPALNWRSQCPTVSVKDVNLREFLSLDIYTDFFMSHRQLPVKCQSCRWRRLCRGGALENRFSSSNGFDNPSVYCEGLQYFFRHVENRLKEGGYPETQLDAQLSR